MTIFDWIVSVALIELLSWDTFRLFFPEDDIEAEKFNEKNTLNADITSEEFEIPSENVARSATRLLLDRILCLPVMLSFFPINVLGVVIFITYLIRTKVYKAKKMTKNLVRLFSLVSQISTIGLLVYVVLL